MDAADTSVAWEAVEQFERPGAPLSSLVAVPQRVATQERPRARGSRAAKIAVMGADALAIAAAMVVAAWIRWVANDAPEALEPLWITAAVSLPVWLIIFARYKLYSAAAISSRTAEFGRITHAVAAAAAGTGLVALVLNASISRAWLFLTFPVALLMVVIERSIVRATFQRARSRGQLQRRVVIIGTNAEAYGVVQMLRGHSQLGYDVVSLVECGTTSGAIAGVPVLGHWRDALSIVQSVDVTGVIIATSSVDIPVANRLARDLMELGYHVELTSGLVDISADRLIARPLGRRPVVYVEPVRLSGWRAAAKRTFDIVVAAGLLLLVSPVLLAAAIAIKLDSPGPVFFVQARVGKNGKLFRVRKFRTMVRDAEQMLDVLRDRSDVDGPLFKMRDDPRVTRVGALLRKWSVDELPQLWNVLLGEMSVVGPRPALASEMSGWADGLQNRLRVKPGITGMWQVNGRSESSFDDYVRHDLYYVDNWSLLTDIAIVAKTVPVVLFGRGAY
jgi:exopolysaccharide biosynthesis polyprenyl glycosylphosphotransferase